jgi:Xaa-Pro aminopeptidase
VSVSYRLTRLWRVMLLFTIVAGCSAQDLPMSDFPARRQRLMEQLPNGIVLLHARATVFGEDQVHGFHQDPSFYYFTGLADLVSGILAVDSLGKESWLFVPGKLSGMTDLSTVYVKPGPETEAKTLIEHVVPWDEFTSYLDRRLSHQPSLTIYLDENQFGEEPASNPPGVNPVEGRFLLGKSSLKQRWPNANIQSAAETITGVRIIKSQHEIEVMRRVAEASVTAMRAALGALKPGASQRDVEGKVVSACMSASGEGPSFWPWIMSGPNAVFPRPFDSFGDYRHLNRTMQNGEVVRVDLGCEVDHYNGDVGRTAPVSGQFDAGQRETWELLVSAYKAGLAAIRDGVTRQQVFDAAIARVRELKSTVHTPLGRQAVDYLLGPDATQFWYLHGAGLGIVDGWAPQTLRANMVIDFEPIFSVGGNGFYMEDMILVKQDGAEVLTTGLPYSADEIQRAVRH